MGQQTPKGGIFYISIRVWPQWKHSQDLSPQQVSGSHLCPGPLGAFSWVMSPCGKDSAIECVIVAAAGETAQERALIYNFSPCATIPDPLYDEPRDISDSSPDLRSRGKHWGL